MRSRVQALRMQASLMRTEGKHSESWMLEEEADKLEKDILRGDINFYMDQYTQAIESGNKSDVVNTGRLLRKKQIKLEGIL